MTNKELNNALFGEWITYECGLMITAIYERLSGKAKITVTELNDAVIQSISKMPGTALTNMMIMIFKEDLVSMIVDHIKKIKRLK